MKKSVCFCRFGHFAPDREGNLKKIIFILTAISVLSGILYFIWCFCSYHAPPKLVREVTYQPELLVQPFPEVLYGNPKAEKIFAEQGINPLYTNRFFEKRPMIPMILKGKKIRRLTSGWFSTDEITIEFTPGNSDTLYCYYVDERYNNFLVGLFQ